MNEDSLVEQPANDSASTEFDDDFAKVSELFWALVTEDVSALELLHSKGDVHVRGKDLDPGFFLATEWESPFSPRAFLDFFYDLDERKRWDKNVTSIQRKATGSPDFNITHTVFKKVPMVSQRDLLIVSKEVQSGRDLALMSWSVEDSEFPVPGDTVRMQLSAGGYFLQAKDDGGSKVTSVTNCNFGGNLPSGLIKRLTASNMPKFVQALSTAMKQFYSKH